MSDLKKSRSVRKAQLEKSYGDLSVLIAEDDVDGIKTYRELMKSLYVNFREVHTEYYENLRKDADIEESEVYLHDVQKLYTEQLNTAKTTLNVLRTQNEGKQDVHYQQSF